jgi:hypothetical protein
MFGMVPAALAMIFRETQVKTMSTASSMLASPVERE